MTFRQSAGAAFLAVLLVPLGSLPAAAQWEIEADPFAYMVNGFSAHVGRQLDDGRMRVQLGTFGADVPRWLHGEDDFDLRVRDGTLKAEYYFKGETQGWFVGLDGDYSRVQYRLRQTRETERRTVGGFGPRMGYRFEPGERLYVTPWVSFRYLFNAEDVVIGESRFEENRFSVFPPSTSAGDSDAAARAVITPRRSECRFAFHRRYEDAGSAMHEDSKIRVGGRWLTS